MKAPRTFSGLARPFLFFLVLKRRPDLGRSSGPSFGGSRASRISSSSSFWRKRLRPLVPGRWSRTYERSLAVLFPLLLVLAWELLVGSNILSPDWFSPADSNSLRALGDAHQVRRLHQDFLVRQALAGPGRDRGNGRGEPGSPARGKPPLRDAPAGLSRLRHRLHPGASPSAWSWASAGPCGP